MVYAAVGAIIVKLLLDWRWGKHKNIHMAKKARREHKETIATVMPMWCFCSSQVKYLDFRSNMRALNRFDGVAHLKNN